MKKYLLLLLLLPITCLAKTIDIVDSKIDIDEDKYIVVTRDNIKDNEDFQKVGIKDTDLINYFEKNDCYLDAVEKESAKEILVFVKDTDLKRNLHIYKEKEIKKIEEEAIKSLDIINHSIYSNDKYKYITMYYKDDDLYVINYYTAINGKGYTIKYQSIEEITDEEKESFKQVIDHISFRLDDKYEKKSSGIDWIKMIVLFVLSFALGALTALIKIKRKRAKE